MLFLFLDKTMKNEQQRDRDEFSESFMIYLNQVQEQRQKLMNKPSKQTKNTVIIIPGLRQQEPKEKQMQSKRPDWSAGVVHAQGSIQRAIKHYIDQINSLQFENNRLSMQLRKSLEDKKQLADLIASFQQISKEDTDQKKKRVRRCANQIERKYICTVKGCEKSYGTEGSMAQHMRLKHPQVDYSFNNNNSSQQKNKRDYKQEQYQEDNSDS